MIFSFTQIIISFFSEITTEILPEILEQVQQECLIFIQSYAKKTVASLHEDIYDKQVSKAERIDF